MLRRKTIVAGMIAAGAIVAAVLFSMNTFHSVLPSETQMDVKLSKVLLVNSTQSSQSVTLEVFFDVYNPSDTARTISDISYQLFSDGQLLGRQDLSYGNVAVSDRPEFYPKSHNSLPTILSLTNSNSTTDIFSKIKNDSADIKWKAIGAITTESGITSTISQFSSEL